MGIQKISHEESALRERAGMLAQRARSESGVDLLGFEVSDFDEYYTRAFIEGYRHSKNQMAAEQKRLDGTLQGLSDAELRVRLCVKINRCMSLVAELRGEMTEKNNRIAELEARKCSHGDYRMQGTTDCSRYPECDGRTEIYVIGEGLCIECQHKKRT